ncbi:Crp/Fnr family transcriptional regulator [Aliiroseovarius sp. S1339]|uniref:Crp/Fnr family transcriptional regulator n=1 Tax=Aliiroseovarius sp. S1339 TaxID=2936990 RepID=UPI0020BE85B9|nr:Crp/Fnr family transcriptional regulator [Aliiroseovarius sp. S1339]MCK8462446.1 Crp/Fnr family transcriptional regulator [Aliiroseovarius sp. S1339]
MYMTSPAKLKAHPVATVPLRQPRGRLPYCLQTGANLFREGDACSGLFEVESGVFRLSRVTRGGSRYVVGFGFPGDILGYGPDQHHISDCDALIAAKVISHRPRLLQSNDAEPEMQQVLFKGALRQVEAMQEHCMMLSCKSARDRIAAFLSFLGDRIGVPLGRHVVFELPMPREDIADYLGLTRETVSRSLTELRRAKLIEIKNIHQIILLRPQLPDALAGQRA